VDVGGLDVASRGRRDDDVGDAVAELAAELLGRTKDDIRGQDHLVERFTDDVRARILETCDGSSGVCT
jgi:hypothetical protein